MSKRISTIVTAVVASFLLTASAVGVGTTASAAGDSPSNGQTVIAGGLWCC